MALTGSVVDAGWKFNPPALLSVEQAAWFLFARDDETVRKRVRRLILRGDLKFVADGSRYWVPWSEIQRFKGERGEIDT